MQSKAQTVEEYLRGLPEDRREAISAVREVILKNLDKDYQEGMQYGMIGYAVPHRVFPAGYHCDPKQPLPFASVASQKNHMAVYLMSLYGSPEEEAWFREAWAAEIAAGRAKKLDMGKSCIRFKRLEDISLKVIGQAIKRMPAKKYIARYEAVLAGTKGGSRPTTSGAAAPAKKAPVKKASGTRARGSTRGAAKKKPARG